MCHWPKPIRKDFYQQVKIEPFVVKNLTSFSMDFDHS
nr:MAG TPA: hypothetical protein [Caudoviricetes sp.]